jgi:hypothetical protein
LKDILGIVPVVENTAGGVQDHRPMTAEQFREGPFIVLNDKMPQELLVGPPARAGLGDELAELPKNSA